MKKMIFAMTIATGVLAASFANAQKPASAATKTSKTATAKPADAKTKEAKSGAATTKPSAPKSLPAADRKNPDTKVTPAKAAKAK